MVDNNEEIRNALGLSGGEAYAGFSSMIHIIHLNGELSSDRKGEKKEAKNRQTSDKFYLHLSFQHSLDSVL